MMIQPAIEAKLKEYAVLLLKWNKSINLVARSTENDLWQRHILDSAQIFEYFNPEESIIDLGSGGGLPGIVLSIMGIKNITLIESDLRKCIFLKQASLSSENKITIVNKRIEECTSSDFIQPSWITSRALTSISNLLQYNRIFAPTKGFLLLKGKNFQKELEEAKETWHFESKYSISKTNPDAAILEITNVRQKT